MMSHRLNLEAALRRAERQRQEPTAPTEVRWDGVCPACGGTALYAQRQTEAQARIFCKGCDTP